MAFGDFTVDRNSTKYVLGSGGDIISYATDEPAFEFNADGSYKGLLVEPAATNICLQSEDINTTWNATRATPTQDTEETPDGDTSSKYIKLVDNGSTGENSVFLGQTITVSGGTKYTASVFLKKDGLDWALLVAGGTGGSPDANPSQYFDLDNGVLGTGTAGIQDATIKAYPNDWYRCSITWTQGAGDTSFTFYIQLADGDNDFTVPLDGTSSIFVWGAQVETGPVATSYIPTTTGSANRAADQITLTSASSLIGQTEGTLYVEAYIPKLSYGPFVVAISDGLSLSEAIYLYVNPSSNLTALLRTGGSTTTISIAEANWTAGLNKVAIKYKVGTNNSALVLNGGSPVTGSPANLPDLNRITLGSRPDSPGGLALNGHIRSVALFTRGLSDAELQALTTP